MKRSIWDDIREMRGVHYPEGGRMSERDEIEAIAKSYRNIMEQLDLAIENMKTNRKMAAVDRLIIVGLGAVAMAAIVAARLS